MASTTTTFAPILTPAQVGDLVIQPLIVQSIAGQVLTPVPISTNSYRIPVITADPSASWTAEGAEIAVTDATLTELDVTPSKLAALSIISRELADDSTPQAAVAVGDGIVRDLVRKMDQALFTATTTNGPGGLPGLSGVTSVSGPASAYTSIDPFSDAIFTAAQHNSQIDAWVTNPATAMALAKIKQYSTGASNMPLLGPDPTAPGRRQILGVPLLTSPYVSTTNNVCGISKSHSYFVIRDNGQVESDRSVFFTSDRVAIKATVRACFAFPNPAGVVKIVTT